jgi:hypothetical protein
MAAPPTRPPNFSALLQRQRSHVSASERMQASKAKYMAVASSIAVAPSIDCDEAWGPIAWSIDLVQHILEEQNAGMRAQGAGLSNEFFITAYSINVTVQQRAMRGAQILYERYANEVSYITRSSFTATRLLCDSPLTPPHPIPPRVNISPLSPYHCATNARTDEKLLGE